MDNSNVFENLGSEDRSSESDSCSNVSGLIEPGTERRNRQPITAGESTDVLYSAAGNVPDVSILINSGTRVNSDLVVTRGGHGPAHKVVEQTGREDDTRTGRSSVSGHVPVVPGGASLESRGPHVRREDLSASALDSLAHTEVTSFPRRVINQPNEGEYSERGLTDQPPGQAGALLTQVLPANRSLREPSGRYKVEPEGEESLPPPPLSKPPVQSAESRGGVVNSLVWEVEEEVEAARDGSYPLDQRHQEEQQLSREEILEQQLLLIVEEEVSLGDGFGNLAARAVQLADQKTAILDQLHPGSRQTRELLLRARKEGGTAAAVVLLEQDEQHRLLISNTDLIIRAIDAWQDGVNLLQGVLTPPQLHLNIIQEHMELIASLLERRGSSSVGRYAQQDQWRVFHARHMELFRRLEGQTKVTRAAQEMFPPDLAMEIWVWYTRLGPLLQMLEIQDAEANETSVIISQLLDCYPGPRFELRPEASATPTPGGNQQQVVPQAFPPGRPA